MIGPRLGLSKSHPELLAKEKQQFLDDLRQRNAVEGKISQVKRRFGLGLIREQLTFSKWATIALNVLLMDLERMLERLFVLFSTFLRLLLVNVSGQSIRTLSLKLQMAAS